VVIHLVAYLVDVGYPRMTAAMVLSLVGLLSVPGRILFGLLTDRYSGRFSLITSFTCSNLGILALVSLYYIKLSVMLYVFVVLFGLAFGARTAAIGPMAATRFQGPHFGAIFGFFLLSQNIGAMAGPWLMGYLFDISKDYRLAFLIASASLVMAIISSSLTGQKKSS